MEKVRKVLIWILIVILFVLLRIPSFILKAIIAIFWTVVAIIYTIGTLASIVLDSLADMLYFVSILKFDHWWDRAAWIVNKWIGELINNIKKLKK